MWSTLTNDQIKKNWTKLGILTSFFKEPGLYNDDPFHELVKDRLQNEQCLRDVFVGAVAVDNGEYQVFNSNHNWSNYSDYIVASGSAPGFFPPQKINDRLWMDGGTAYNLELPILVDFCRKKGYADSDIKVDVILLSPTSSLKQWEKAGSTAETNYLRAKEIRSFMKTGNVLAGFIRANPSVGFRYLIKPDHELIREINLVNFKQSRSQKLIE